jgi:hypothetical protein
MRQMFVRETLDELALRHGTDKSSRGHDYMRFYEFFLRGLKQEEFTFLELGVGPPNKKGKSLLAWRDYFPKAQIVGVDKREDAKDVEDTRIRVEIGNCANRDFLQRLASQYAPTVILDDASHKWSHQILALHTLFPGLPAGGIYIVEDLQTSFKPVSDRGYADSPEDTATHLLRLTCAVAGRGAEHAAADSAPPGKAIAELAEMTDAIMFYRKTALLVRR